MSKINDQIAEVFREWGKKSSLDLTEEATAALVRAGRKNPQGVGLQFKEVLSTSPDGSVTLEIVARKQSKPVKYWKAIEEGRQPGKRQPPSDVFGKQWQNEQQIDARVVLLQIQARKKKGVSVPNRKFKRLKKTLNYDKAVKQLSFIIAMSIGKKGIKPKPYLGKVLNDENIAVLRKDLTPLLGERFKLIIKGLE